MSLGEIVLHAILEFVLANMFRGLVLIVIGVFAYDFYNRFMRVNKNTDNINLLDRYVRLTYHRNRRGKK